MPNHRAVKEWVTIPSSVSHLEEKAVTKKQSAITCNNNNYRKGRKKKRFSTGIRKKYCWIFMHKYCFCDHIYTNRVDNSRYLSLQDPRIFHFLSITHQLTSNLNTNNFCNTMCVTVINKLLRLNMTKHMCGSTHNTSMSWRAKLDDGLLGRHNNWLLETII